jgi:hypothetical protein
VSLFPTEVVDGGVTELVGVLVGGPVVSEVGGVRSQVGALKVSVSRVTAPVRAKARPCTVTPAVTVIEVSAAGRCDLQINWSAGRVGPADRFTGPTVEQWTPGLRRPEMVRTGPPCLFTQMSAEIPAELTVRAVVVVLAAHPSVRRRSPVRRSNRGLAGFSVSK